MTAKTRSWVRFVAFLGANALVVAAAYLLAVDPLLDLLRDQRKRIDHGRMIVKQRESAVARNEAFSPGDLSELDRIRGRFIQGEGTNPLNGDLLTRLRHAADHQEISLTSVTLLPPREWFGRELVGARLEFTAPTGKAANMLIAIEDGPSFLFIRRAKLAPFKDALGGQDAVAATIEVYGIALWRKA